ncbi:hypothetical protein Nepgr_017491 [Nepenthes gracilis]|uniref:Uncharacterized protein n=1 Tax=Nepenthes gracilis TaxID=150966 RepID=A0AAD3SPH5_NEPGR|nr:hypothetical protein Nepgr_017491 [Nepenthes gracilis]
MRGVVSCPHDKLRSVLLCASLQISGGWPSNLGELEFVKEIQRKGVSEKRENGDDRNMGIAVDGGAENRNIIREASRMPFLMLGLDLPPRLFSRIDGSLGRHCLGHGVGMQRDKHIGGYRGWRLRWWRLGVLEAFIVILTFAQLFYLLLLHLGMFSSKHGPG